VSIVVVRLMKVLVFIARWINGIVKGGSMTKTIEQTIERVFIVKTKMPCLFTSGEMAMRLNWVDVIVLDVSEEVVE
jgi:hypothetical protein